MKKKKSSIPSFCIFPAVLLMAAANLLIAQPPGELLVFTQIGSGRLDGTSYRTVFRLQNEGPETSTGEFQYHGSEGSPAQVELEPRWVGESGTLEESEGRFAFTIPGGSSLLLELIPGQTPFIGWARLYKDPQTVATAFFQYARSPENPDTMALEDSLQQEAEIYPVREMKDLSFPVSLFDGTQEINTAFALVNLSARPTAVTLKLRPDQSREVIIEPGHLFSSYFTAFWDVAFPAIFPLKVETAAEAHSEAPLGIAVFRTLNGVPMSGVRAVGLPLSTESVPAELGSEFEIPYGATAAIPSESLEVTFWNVPEDSRCPTGVVCIWEGQARIVLRVQKDGEPPGEIELIDRAGNKELATGKLGGYTFQLLGVEPYPSEPGKIELDDYRARLRVDRAPVED